MQQQKYSVVLRQRELGRCYVFVLHSLFYYNFFLTWWCISVNTSRKLLTDRWHHDKEVTLPFLLRSLQLIAVHRHKTRPKLCKSLRWKEYFITLHVDRLKCKKSKSFEDRIRPQYQKHLHLRFEPGTFHLVFFAGVWVAHIMISTWMRGSCGKADIWGPKLSKTICSQTNVHMWLIKYVTDGIRLLSVLTI